MSIETASCNINSYDILRLNLNFGGKVGHFGLPVRSPATFNAQKTLVNLKRGKPDPRESLVGLVRYNLL